MQGEKVKCSLCEKQIKSYSAVFNHLIIDEKHGLDICTECADKIIKWQGQKYALLFPTKNMKKRYEKK
jgi:hypothetical protein